MTAKYTVFWHPRRSHGRGGHPRVIYRGDNFIRVIEAMYLIRRLPTNFGGLRGQRGTMTLFEPDRTDIYFKIEKQPHGFGYLCKTSYTYKYKSNLDWSDIE